MTVAADLQLAQGCRRRYLLKIGGLAYVLNQRVADPSGDDTPLGGGGYQGVNALRIPGQEVGEALDLGALKTESGSMVFQLDDVPNG